MAYKNWDLTPRQAEQAKALRNTPQRRPRGMGYYPYMGPRKVALLMGVTEEQVRRALGMETYRHKNKDSDYFRTERLQVPDKVIDERNRRMDAPVSLNIVFLGDPREGQSALDKRNETTQS